MSTIDLNLLQHYMFTQNHMMNIWGERKGVASRKDKKEPSKKQIIKTNISTKENFLLPKYPDTFFWCFYIIHYGLFKYESLTGSSFTEASNTKIQMVENLRNYKELLKNKKWKRSVIENDLVNEKTISVGTFLCICAINSINVIVLKQRCLYIQESQENAPFELVVYGEHGYMLSQHDDKEKQSLISEYKIKYWIVDNINKPLAAVSSYKVGGLRDICIKLEIPITTNAGKKYTKKQLYDLINCKI